MICFRWTSVVGKPAAGFVLLSTYICLLSLAYKQRCVPQGFMNSQLYGGTGPFSCLSLCVNRQNQFSIHWLWSYTVQLFCLRYSFLCAISVFSWALPQHTQCWAKANLSTQLSKRDDFAWADGNVHWRVESISMSVGIVGSAGAVSDRLENKMWSNGLRSVSLETVSEESIC